LKKIFLNITADNLLKIVIICILFISILANFFEMNFFYKEENSFCVFHRITGYKCPGCGMTRAFLAIGRFKLLEAFKYNIFSIPLFMVMLIYILGGKETFVKIKKNNFLIFVLLLLVISYWILRNII